MDSCIWSTGRVPLEVRRQHGTNGTLRFRGAFRGGIDWQARHVGAHSAIGFGFPGQSDRDESFDTGLTQDAVAQPPGVLLGVNGHTDVLADLTLGYVNAGQMILTPGYGVRRR